MTTVSTRVLSKSKILAHRQCPKRLWLELNHTDEAEYSEVTKAAFADGNTVGAMARQLYDPEQRGQNFEYKPGALGELLKLTAEALLQRIPLFEAAFSADGALVLADVLLPVKHRGKRAWRMVEVKSSTAIKQVHRDDVAIQAFTATQSGLPLVAISLAHINKLFIYKGNGNYDGLFVEHDLTKEAFARTSEVHGWVRDAQLTARKRTEPAIRTGAHCNDPYVCAFMSYCEAQETQAEYPVHWLPKVQRSELKAVLDKTEVKDLRDVPDRLLNRLQLRVKQHSISGKPYFDREGAAQALAAHKLPAYFLDFETIAFAVPQWKETRPFQAVPFQFSLHRLSRTLKLSHTAFLDLSGADPRAALAHALLNACGTAGPVFVYYKGFEAARIRELAKQFNKLSPALLALNARLVDLLPIARDHYYHPNQQGSWSIKAVLPAMVPGLSYDKLDGVQDGGGAQAAYVEAAFPDMLNHPIGAPPLRTPAQIENQLLDYCRLDTFAMVQVWAKLADRKDVLRLPDID